MTFPAMHDMWGQWAPSLESSKLTTFCYAGKVLNKKNQTNKQTKPQKIAMH